MNLHLLYAAIDGAHIAFLLVIAIRLLALAPRNRNVQLIVLIAFGAVCAVVSARHSYMAVLPAEFAVDLGPLIIPMNLARNLTSGLVMVLCHSIFRDGSRLPPPLLAVWAVQMSLEEPLEWMAPAAWELAQPHAKFVLYEVVPSALQIVMLGFALVWALRESDADLVEARRKTRAVLVVVSVAHIVLALLVERLALQIWALPIDVVLSRAYWHHRPRPTAVRRHRPAAPPTRRRAIRRSAAPDARRHRGRRQPARVRRGADSGRVRVRARVPPHGASPSERSPSTSGFRSTDSVP